MGILPGLLRSHLTLTITALLVSGEMARAGLPQSDDGSAGKGTNPLIRMTASFEETPNFTDCTVIYFTDKATEEYDSQLDAIKLMNTDVSVPNLFTVTPGGINLSINALPPIAGPSCKVELGLKNDIPGYVIFKIISIDTSLLKYDVFISDVVTGTEQRMLPDQQYKIYLPPGEYKGRFFINLSTIKTGFKEETEAAPFSISYSHGIIRADIKDLAVNKGTFKMYDLNGHVLIMRELHEPGFYEFPASLREGFYIVSLASGKTRKAIKLFISEL